MEKKSDALSETELDAIVNECQPYDGALCKSGHLIVQASLQPARLAITVRPRNARDLNEAMLVVSKYPAAHLGEHVGWGIEVRH